jgi:hypothetical protein
MHADKATGRDMSAPRPGVIGAIRRGYQRPRLTTTERTVALIRGAWHSGYTDSRKDFYHYGE